MKNSNYRKNLELLAAVFFVYASLSLTFFKDSINIKTLFPDMENHTRIDSLNNYLVNLNNDSIRLELGKKCVELSDSLNYNTGKAEALIIVGTSFEKLNKRDSALSYYKKAYSVIGVKRELSRSLKEFKKIDPSERSKTLSAIKNVTFSLGNYFSTSQQFDSSLFYFRKSISAAAKNKDSLMMSTLLNTMGVTHWRMGEFSKAIRLYTVALSFRRNLKDNKLIVQSLNNLGASYYHLGNYKLALDKFIEAIKIRKTYVKTDSPILLNNLGLIHLKLNDLNPAIHYFKRSLNLAKRQESKLGMGYSYLNLGDFYFVKNKLDSAITNYKLGKKYYEEIDDINGVVKIINKLGEVYLKKGATNLAKKYFSEAYKTSNKKELHLTEAASLFNLSKIDFQNTNYSAALQKLDTVENIAKNNFFNDLLLEVYLLQAKIYQNLKDYKTALHYHSKYDKLKNRLVDESNLRIIADAKEKYRSEQKEEQNLLLRSENIAKDNQLKSKQRGIMYAIATSIFGLFVIVYLVFGSIERNKRERIVLKSKIEIEKINSKLTKANKELENSNATKDRLFSIIAHDLKNPFNTMLGATQILKNEFAEMTQEDQLEIIDIIYNDTRKLYTLLENLLFWANSQRGNNKPTIVKLNLQNSVDEILRLYTSSAEKKNIDILIDIPNNIYVLFDKFMFNTIIRNLLSNAIKFTYSGGKIILKVIDLEDKIHLLIQDNGMGISKNNLEKIFDAGSNFKGLGTENESGTGLGLMLCKDFAKINNADISVNSIEKEGTTFKLVLQKVDM